MASSSPTVVRRHDLDGRPLVVLDGLFDLPFIELIHHVMRVLPFSLSDYDTEETQHVLHWKYEFDLAKSSPLPIIPLFINQIVSATKGIVPERELRWQRMYCNCNLYGDIQYPHSDLPAAVTSLYYANAAWESRWMGETYFYDSTGEPVYTVLPKPGRLVVFDAAIVHRGGVPSRECCQARMSVAFKFVEETATRRSSSQYPDQ